MGGHTGPTHSAIAANLANLKQQIEIKNQIISDSRNSENLGDKEEEEPEFAKKLSISIISSNDENTEKTDDYSSPTISPTVSPVMPTGHILKSPALTHSKSLTHRK